MNRLHFKYSMQLFYSEPVNPCHFTIKCIPRDTARQRLQSIDIEMDPKAAYTHSNDSFGNEKIIGSVREPHNHFYLTVEGEVDIQQILYEEEADLNKIALFKYPFGKTIPGESIHAYHRKLMVEASEISEEKRVISKEISGMPEEPKETSDEIREISDKASEISEKTRKISEEISEVSEKTNEKSVKACEVSSERKQVQKDYDKALYIMHRLHSDMKYKSGVTDLYTTAEEAFRMKKGVCQDYAHIYIALAKLAGIPARYVAGLMIGEGMSHAWVEVLCKGKWIGIDPTNNLLVDDNYIKLGHGRDAFDCQINLGIMHGGGKQRQRIEVLVDVINDIVANE